MGCYCSAAIIWLNKIRQMDIRVYADSSQNTRYSCELKQTAVNDYFLGLGSYTDICKKYRISSNTQLREWVMMYNSHEKLKTPRLITHSKGASHWPILISWCDTLLLQKIKGNSCWLFPFLPLPIT